MAIQTLAWNVTPPDSCRRGAVAIGNFDGVHRGHAALVAELRKQAQGVRGPAVILTFDPHPLQLLRPEQFQPLLTTSADRAALLERQGADCVLLLQTTLELLQLSAEEFFAQVIRQRLDARALVEGTNFGFGRNREGTVETLAQLCRRDGLGLVLVPPVQVNGTRVSSSRVRDALLQGAVREAANLLGRPYLLRGTVGTGQRRGQTLGFPTANLERVPTLVPRDGVYAVRVSRGGTTWPGAANIGPNPTFGEQARKVEIHLIGFQGNLYDQALAVEFLERLRDTRPFAGVGPLVEQLRRDVEQARQLCLQPDSGGGR
jgi:riboflavin kinase/FMN adenylyltransferase